MSLRFEKVSYTYASSAQGLHDVSFEVPKGELVAVIGPSGSGKSTLLKLVAGLLSGHGGRILLGEQDLSPVPVHQRQLGMVFQSYALFPHLTVADNIAYGLKMRGLAAPARIKRAMDLLELVGLSGFQDRSVRQLSGGQQQRVALARALAIDPQALLLDEPLSALDAGIRGQLRDQIRALQQRFGTTTLLVTHDQEEALAMADHVAVLKEGRLLQIASPRVIYEQPVSSAVAGFVGLSTLWPATVSGANRVDTGFAQLAVATGGRNAGTKVHLLIRPEHVEPDPIPEAVNRLEGRPGIQRYFGASCRYDFLIPGSSQALLAESRLVATHAIALSPEHIRVLDN